MKYQQLLTILLVAGVITILFYFGSATRKEVQKEARNIVVDGYDADWKGINPILLIKEDYKIYRYATSKEIFLLFKPIKDKISEKSFIITGQIKDPDFPKDVPTNISRLNLTIYSDRSVSMNFVAGEAKELGQIEFKDVLEVEIPLSTIGIEYGKRQYEILISDENDILVRFRL